jgi:hypothetical protein
MGNGKNLPQHGNLKPSPQHTMLKDFTEKNLRRPLNRGAATKLRPFCFAIEPRCDGKSGNSKES